MIWWVVGAGLALCAGSGLFLGGYRAAQSPAFWALAAADLLNAVLPELLHASPATIEAAGRAAREGRMGDPHAGREK